MLAKVIAANSKDTARAGERVMSAMPFDAQCRCGGLLPALHQHRPFARFLGNVGNALFTREESSAGFVWYFVGSEESFDGLAVDREVDVLRKGAGDTRRIHIQS